MNASSNLVSIRPSDFALAGLLGSNRIAELTRRVEEELFATELGDEFIRSSLEVASDGKSFTLRARPNTAIIVGHVRISSGDVVRFNGNLEARYVAQKSSYGSY